MMLKLLLRLCTIGFLTLISHSSFALVELRLNYGLLTSNPDLRNATTSTATLPSVSAASGLGGDFFISPPGTDFGFGARIEKLTSSIGDSTLKFDSELSRTAALINYRLINTLLFTGPVFTYGLSHSGSFKSIVNGVTITDFSPGSASSYSLGWELGVKLLTFRIGAEVGYESLKWTNCTDAKGALSARDIDFSGTYAVVLLGVGI